MNILGHGIDMVEISRIQAIIERQGEGFTRRVFTEQEHAYCTRHKDSAQYFAARFAAKEAFGKAVGLGIGASGDLQEVEVIHNPSGAPLLSLRGRAEEQFRSIGGEKILLSISHDGGFAIASVILTGKELTP